MPPASNIAGKSPSPNEGTWSEETNDLSGELVQLYSLLQGLERGKMAISVELGSTMAEVAVLKAELSKANEKTLDLWQENCEQLIKYDDALIERDREGNYSGSSCR